MSQRRKPAGETEMVKKTTALRVQAPSSNHSSSNNIDNDDEESQSLVVKGPLSLDGYDTDGSNSQSKNVGTRELTVDEQYQVDLHLERVRHWQDNHFAVGLVEPTWLEEREKQRHFFDRNRYGDDEIMTDSTGCLCCSAMICPLLGAERLGNMSVLYTTEETVEATTIDEETNEKKVEKYTRPKLEVVVGPYWPMLVFVTYPIIIVVSWFAFRAVFLQGDKSPLAKLFWTALTVTLIASLTCTGCRDPGVLYKHDNPPPQDENYWRWSEQAHSWRPKNAYFDSDTGVVVEEFDHTCPWTGTAIGKGNMPYFQTFVCLIFVCLVVDIFFITGVV